MRKTLFISDLHLAENTPAQINYLVNLLQNRAAEFDAIYILGDFFELWLGDDISPGPLESVINLLYATSVRLPIFFQVGNRDFLIGQRFLQASGCRLLPEEVVITIYQRNILLMHGDTLCTLDKAYQRVRILLRNQYVQKIFLNLPSKLRAKLGFYARGRSKRYTQNLSTTLLDVEQKTVEKIMLKHSVNCLIHGHTHRPGIHNFTLAENELSATRIVLGAWHIKASLLILHENGNFELQAHNL